MIFYRLLIFFLQAAMINCPMAGAALQTTAQRRYIPLIRFFLDVNTEPVI
jgi:hypothetical protein